MVPKKQIVYVKEILTHGIRMERAFVIVTDAREAWRRLVFAFTNDEKMKSLFKKIAFSLSFCVIVLKYILRGFLFSFRKTQKKGYQYDFKSNTSNTIEVLKDNIQSRSVASWILRKSSGIDLCRTGCQLRYGSIEFRPLVLAARQPGDQGFPVFQGV